MPRRGATRPNRELAATRDESSMLSQPTELTQSRWGRTLLFAFALTLFLSAFLLFCVQPMIAKKILPLLGGSPSVWNT